MIERRLGTWMPAGLRGRICAGLLARGRRWRARASPPPGRWACRRPVTPIARRHPLVPRLRQHHHHRHRDLRAGAAALRHVPLQREAQPDALAHHAQHARSRWLDRDPGPHPGRDRHPVVQAAVSRSTPIPKPDLTIKATGNQWNWTHEYPDQGGFSVTTRSCCRTTSAQELIKKGMPAGRCRACSPSTTRSSCRSTRSCTCSSPRAT